jgi:hypothetical protein
LTLLKTLFDTLVASGVSVSLNKNRGLKYVCSLTFILCVAQKVWCR